MKEMNVRFAGKSDKEKFLQLAKERDSVIKKNRKLGFWNKKFYQLIKDNRLALAFSNNNAVGFLYFSQIFSDDPPTFYVDLIFVSKDYRQQGVAKGLFRKLEHIAIENGCHLLLSSTEEPNKISIDMHKSLGFVKCGFIKGKGINDGKTKEIFFSKTI